MGGRQEQERVFGVLAISLSVHVFAFIGLGFAPSSTEALRARAIEFEVVQPRVTEPEKTVPKVKDPAESPREKPVVQPKLNAWKRRQRKRQPLKTSHRLKNKRRSTLPVSR